MGGGAGAALTPDGSQLAFVSTDEGRPQVKFWDLATGREARSINLPDKEIEASSFLLRQTDACSSAASSTSV